MQDVLLKIFTVVFTFCPLRHLCKSVRYSGLEVLAQWLRALVFVKGLGLSLTTSLVVTYGAHHLLRH